MAIGADNLWIQERDQDYEITVPRELVKVCIEVPGAENQACSHDAERDRLHIEGRLRRAGIRLRELGSRQQLPCMKTRTEKRGRVIFPALPLQFEPFLPL